jgi:uncharacterized phage protein gp47/JayE
VSLLMTPLTGIQLVRNAAAISAGSDVENDELFRDRLLLALSANQGAGTITDYQKWALSVEGVGRVTIEPLWEGPGTVRVIVTDEDNLPVSSELVGIVQLKIDPSGAGEGKGLAPIGAVVTVATPAVLPVAVGATVSFETGYSIDGEGGTIAGRAAIAAAVGAYVNGLGAGETIVREHLVSRFFQVTGVHDVSSVLINSASSGNVSVGSLQVAELSLPMTLS